MGDVDVDRLNEVLQTVPERISRLEDGMNDLRHELAGLRGELLANRTEATEITRRLGALENRMTRIESRIGPADVTLS